MDVISRGLYGQFHRHAGDGYMVWYRDERIKLEYGMSITGKCRELGFMT